MGAAYRGRGDIGLTGLAVLAFEDAGYDHLSASRHRDPLKKGVQYLLAAQDADGAFGQRNYEHAIATWALAEAYGMTNDPALEEPVRRAVAVLVARQNRDPDGQPFAWDYVGPDMRDDTSVSVWCVCALKAAANEGFDVGTSIAGAERWLTTTWRATNPDWAVLDPQHGESRFPYTCMADNVSIFIAPAPAAGATGPESHDFAGAGAVCALLLGHRRGDPMLETLANYALAHQLPAAYPCNLYYLFEDTVVFVALGGERWKRWNERVQPLLLDAQRRDGCNAGSWDPPVTAYPWSREGRLISTLFALLCLETYPQRSRLVDDPTRVPSPSAPR